MSTVFLLGAGFTRAVIGKKAPLTHELMSKLDISNFPEIRDDYEKAFPDIEQFLSVLDLNVLHFKQINRSFSNHLDNMRENIVQQIIKHIDVETLYIDNLDNYPCLMKFIEIIPANSSILSLNYDCVLEQGLYYSDRWSPFGGYCYTTFPHTEKENDSKENILLLKLHGSCNFRDMESGQDYFNIEVSERIFPGINAHINSDPSDKPHILVMSYIKEFHNGIMSLWREAISLLRKAEKLIVVGCSLREEDTFLRFALYHYGMKENTQKFSVDIVDIGEDNCNMIKDKIMKLVANPDRQEVNLYCKGLESYYE